MLKWFNKKKKDNKGFTLVELVVVVAILAILVGLLAPQYTKYVERARKSADASNLENMVRAVEITAADPEGNLEAGTYTITISKDSTTVGDDGTTGGGGGTTPTAQTDENETLTAVQKIEQAIEAVVSVDFKNTKLKSRNWDKKNKDTSISAKIEIKDDFTIIVTYSPDALLDYIGKAKPTKAPETP